MIFIFIDDFNMKENNIDDGIASIHIHEGGVIEIRDSWVCNERYYISNDSIFRIRLEIYKLISDAMDNSKAFNVDKSRKI